MPHLTRWVSEEELSKPWVVEEPDISYPSTPRRSSSYGHLPKSAKWRSTRAFSKSKGRRYSDATSVEILSSDSELSPSTLPSPDSIHGDGFPLIDSKITRDGLPFPLSPSHIKPTNYVRRSKTRRPSRKYLYETPRSTPDRFVPLRSSVESAPANFRTTKSPYQLSPTERLLRGRSSTWDPFAPRRITSTPQPRHSIPSTSFRNPWTARAGGPYDRHRAASAGAVWNVGGAAPTPNGPLSPVDNGRGGVFGSGTNAPIFSSNFFQSETPDQSHERFEGRLASALDIDQANRIFDYSYPPLPRRKPSRASIPQGSLGPHTVWQDGMWMSSRGAYMVAFLCEKGRAD